MKDLPMFPVSRFVESVRWVTQNHGHARRVDRLPDGRTALVLRIVERDRRGDVTVMGPRTRALFKDATGFLHAVEIRFKPGWSAPLLGVSANTLTDAFVSLEELWGRAGNDLLADLLGARTAPDVLERVERAFARRVLQAFEPTSASVARRAAGLMERGESRVEGIADHLGVTARHLRRAFSENIGISPKDFVRSIRLQKAVRMAAMSSDWGQIAVDAGYYDQSHLIGDFRALVGLTPVAFLRRVSEIESIAPDEAFRRA